jgi:hypothetical protein
LWPLLALARIQRGFGACSISVLLGWRSAEFVQQHRRYQLQQSSAIMYMAVTMTMAPTITVEIIAIASPTPIAIVVLLVLI